MHCDLMTSAMNILDSRIVGVFVANEESCLHITTVGVLAFSVENISIKFNVVVVDRIIKSYGDHLWYAFSW